MRSILDLRAAFGWLTALPVGEVSSEARPVRFFPLVGLVLGSVGGVTAWLGVRLVHGALADLLVGVAVVGIWAVLTRLLHWDGLADTTDGLLGGSTPNRRLEIMRDSAIGAFGAFTVGFVLVAQVVCVGVLVGTGDTLEIVLAPLLGRLAASFALWTNAPARADGLGRTLAGSDGVGGWIVAALPLMVVALRPELSTVPVVVCGAVAAFAVPKLLSSRVGGVTGDIVGASVLIVETLVLAAFAVAKGL